MIPGLTFGASSSSNNGQASWAASWSANISGPKPPSSRLTPSQIAQQNLREAALASRPAVQPNLNLPYSTSAAPSQLNGMEYGDDDDYEPDDLMEDGEVDDMYEPEMPSSQEHPAVAADDDEYDPDDYEPEMEMDMSPKMYDSDGCASPGTGTHSAVISLPGEQNPPNSNPLAVSSGARDAADLIDQAEAVENLSVVDAYKKAQAAILRLWPLEVRYQQYIDEGIDESIVKELFDALGLDKSSEKQETVSATISQDTLKPVSMDQPFQNGTSPGKVPSSSAPGEERKDRIARLLAMKKAQAASVPISAAASPSAPPTKPASSQPTINREALIKQKLEALKSMRNKKQLAQPANDHAEIPASALLVSTSQSQTPTTPQIVIQSSQSGPLQRPGPRSLPDRTSLIIDVSSDEDDESENDEAMANGTGRTNSGLSSAAGPTGAQVSQLEIEIMKLKSQIAEKEARKSIFGTASPLTVLNQHPAAGGTNATLTGSVSQSQTHTVPVLAQKLNKLTQANEAAGSQPNTANGRKGPMTGLPGVKAQLAEKMARLQAVNNEAMQLLKEIQDVQQTQRELEMNGEADKDEDEDDDSEEGAIEEDEEHEYEQKEQEQEANALVATLNGNALKKVSLLPLTPIPAAIYYSDSYQNMVKASEGKQIKQPSGFENLSRGQRKKMRKKMQQAEAAAAELARKKEQARQALETKKLEEERKQREAKNKRLLEEKAAELKAKLLARGPLNSNNSPSSKITTVVQSPASAPELPVAPVEAPAPEPVLETMPNVMDLSSDSSPSENVDVEMIGSDLEGETQQVALEPVDIPIGAQSVEPTDYPMEVSSDESSSSDEDGEVMSDNGVQAQPTVEADETIDTTNDADVVSMETPAPQDPADTSSEASDSGDSDSSNSQSTHDSEGQAKADYNNDDDEYEPADIDEPMAGGRGPRSPPVAVRVPTALKDGAPATPTSSSPRPSWSALKAQKRKALESAAAKRVAREKAIQESERQKSEIVEVPSSDNEDSVGPVNVFGRRPETYDVVDQSVQNPKYPGVFVPYESIYKGTPMFCFHRDFFEIVPKGLRSFTYSNKIDPKWCICTDDLTGQCKKGADRCPWQHLDECTLSEDKIILNLGNNEGLSEADKTRYIDGLRKMLIKFKGDHGQGSLETLGRTIIEYRQEFMGDPSRVRLEDVKI